MFLVTFVFIGFDFLTGLIKAFRTKAFTSSLMREGMFHKAGSLLFMLLGIITEQATLYFDLGLNVPINNGICTYIVAMELGSIIENIGAINPAILPSKVREYFGKLKE